MRSIHTRDAERRLVVAEDMSYINAINVLDMADDLLSEDFDEVPEEIKHLISNSPIFNKIAEFYTEQVLKAYDEANGFRR